MINNIDIKNDDLNSNLALCINKYLQKSYTSINHLSKITGISRPTISKLIEQNANLERIDPTKIIKLIKVIEKDKAHKFLLKYDIELRGLSNIFSYAIDGIKLDSSKSSHIPENLINIFFDSDCLITFLLSQNTNGISMNDLNYLIGSRAKSAVNLLLENELIQINSNGKIYSLVSEEIFSNLNHKKIVIKELLNRCNTRSKKQNSLFMWHKTDNISNDGLQLLQSEFEKFLSKITSIIKNNPGDIPAFFATFMDRFIEEKKSNIEN